MQNKQRRWIWILLAVAGGLFAVGAVWVWNQPLFGARLPQPAATQESAPPKIEQPILEETEPAADVGEQADDSLETSQQTQPTAQPFDVPPSDGASSDEPLCGGPESMSVLVLGIDENAQADAIRLVRVDFSEEKVSVLSIPRDFYVPIVDMAEHGIVQGRINAAYGYGEKFNGRGQGIVSVANNLEYNFGVTFDHYIVLNFDNIDKYIDQIGGVEITLEKPATDGKLYFAAGDHHMDGRTAVGFMRMRYYDTDFARIRRQSMIIKAFYTRAIDELNFFELSQLALKGLVDRNIQTDFAVKDISPLICLARQVDGNDVAFVEIPGDLYQPFTTSAGGNVQIPDFSVGPFIRSVMDGTVSP